MGIRNSLSHAWNAFNANQVTRLQRPNSPPSEGSTSGVRQDRPRRFSLAERSIITSAITRIATDTADVDLRHAKVDANDRYLEDIDSGLNNCLTLEANLDQAATDFKRDMVLTLLEEGVIALCPIDTSVAPNDTGAFDIVTIRVGKIVKWYANHVDVSVYNERSAKREELQFSKREVAIIENPFYSIMNEPNSTYQRLIRKLNILDAIDEASGSGKLDIIIQLPYTLRSETRKAQAAERRQQLEDQLSGSKYALAISMLLSILLSLTELPRTIFLSRSSS